MVYEFEFEFICHLTCRGTPTFEKRGTLLRNFIVLTENIVEMIKNS